MENGFVHEKNEDMDATMAIAVVGIGFRGPGDAVGVHGFWDMIREKREARTPVPKSRFNNEAFYHPDAGRNGTSNVAAGHFFKEDLAKFDAPFYNMTSAEATALDPQQRLLLECTYEAFENGGVPLEKATGSDTSVFMGTFFQDYTDMLLRDPESLPLYQSTCSGQSRAMISNRISYLYDLKGPSVTIDTACSSSLVALHLACQSLRTGESKQAIVGGANVILSHEVMITMSMMRFLSPDGRCYTFDSRANGYARGEGAGCLFLKPLADALRDGDPIRGIIRNSGVNQDGKTAGITLPSREAQETLIRRVYQQARLDPLETSYVEAHGTGTPAGDPLEARAISSVFCGDVENSRYSPLPVGSVKTNVGHLEGASGVASVVKAILMLENRVILPNRNFEAPNPRIPLTKWNIRVPQDVEPWTAEGNLRASINSFGYGGTNAHIIIESASDYLKSRGLSGHTFEYTYPFHRRAPEAIANGYSADLLNGNRNHTNGIPHVPQTNGHAHVPHTNGHHETSNLLSQRLIVLQSHDQTAGKRQAERLAAHLAEDSSYSIDDIAYTLNERRTDFPWKAFVTAGSTVELADKLKEGVMFVKRVTKPPIIGFVFTGQGAQWHAMGRELIQTYPVFRESLEKATAVLKGFGAPWDALEELSRNPETTRVNQAAFSQPLCTAVQLGLVDVLRTWDVIPSRVVGHSSGEIAAAYAAGSLSFSDALAVAYYRGIAAMSLQQRKVVDGAMLAAALSRSEVLPILSELTQGRAVVACENSPSSITVAGDYSAIDELETILKEKRLFARRLVVDIAYHSHHMEHVKAEYLSALRTCGVHAQPPTIDFFSSVTGARLNEDKAGEELGPEYWVANMLSEVKFSPALQALCTERDSARKTSKRSVRRRNANVVDVLLELGPHSALAGPVKQILQSQQQSDGVTYLATLTRNKPANSTMLSLAGSLVANGKRLPFAAVNPSTSSNLPRLLSTLPAYPWSHATSYWAESRISKAYKYRQLPRTDLLGALATGSNALEPTWRNFLRLSELPWLQDHKVQGQVVCPGAGYVIMALEAARQMVGGHDEITGFKLRELVIRSALVVSEASINGAGAGDGTEIHVSLRRWNDSLRVLSESWYEFAVFSVTEDGRWTEHCRGLVGVEKERAPRKMTARERELVDSAYQLCTTPVATNHLYTRIAELGIQYGPTFANMTSALAEGEVQNTKKHHHSVATVIIPDTAAIMPMGFQHDFTLHPATLDSFLHAMFAAISSQPLRDPVVPVSIREIRIDARVPNEPGRKLQVLARCRWKNPMSLLADLVVVEAESSQRISPLISITGLSCTTIARSIASTSPRSTIAEENETHCATYTADWKPDVSFLSAQDFVALCPPLQPDQSAPASLDLIERAAFHLMQRALGKLSVDRSFEEAILPLHTRKLLRLMRSRVMAKEDDGEVPKAWHMTPELERREVILAASQAGGEGALVVQAGESLGDVLRGRADALSVLTANDRLAQYYADNVRFERNYEQAAAYMRLLAFKNPGLRILEVGAGTGGATKVLLQALSGHNQTDDGGGRYARFETYDFTDVSSGFFDGARQRLAKCAGAHLVQYKKLDIENDPVVQGFAEGAYDVVVAANVLHATESMEKTLGHVRKTLRPGGHLILIELTKERMATSITFGTLPGWWIANRPDGPCCTEPEWDGFLRHTGFKGLKYSVHDCEDSTEYRGSVMIAEASLATSKPPAYPSTVILPESGVSEETIVALKERLEGLGVPKTSVSSFNSPRDTSFEEKVCIVLTSTNTSILRDPSAAQFEVLKRALLTSYGLLWVSHASVANYSDPTHQLATGLLRTLRSEKGGNSRTVLLHGGSQTNIDNIIEVFIPSFNTSVSLDPLLTDVEFAAEPNPQGQNVVHIPRLLPATRVDTALSSALPTADGSATTITTIQPFRRPNGPPLNLEIASPGLLDTLQFVEDTRVARDSAPPLGSDEVEIEVCASGLNFRDVMMAMGQIELEPFGGECAGVVTAIGRHVTNVAVGDRVVTYKVGCFSTRVRQNCDAVQRLPDEMSFATAAALPVTYCTAWYALVKVARIQKAETVLIHAASGGLGQAAINVAHLLGAVVYATVGTTEKRELLQRQFGIPSERIFDSRDASAFSEGVMEATKGVGVDVVLNSVSGEALRRTWGLVAPFGRFIELGKRDFVLNSRLEMEGFRRNVTFAAVDLVGLITEQPALGAIVWGEVMNLVRDGKLKAPSPIVECGFGDIEAALRTMQSGRHMGKLVAVPRSEDRVKVVQGRRRTKLFKGDASYLLVGGLGGVGRAIAEWMAEEGAKYLIFSSRSGLAKKEAQEIVALLEGRGVKVVVYQVDVASKEQVQDLIRRARAEMPPVRGVIQGAMVLNDSYLNNLTHGSYLSTLLPKVHGTQNLQNSLCDPSSPPLDFFILLSSLSGILGNASQSAYAAASTYLDAYAQHLRTISGIPTTSIDLGVVRDVGYVAENLHLARAIEHQGISATISSREIMALLESAVSSDSNSHNLCANGPLPAHIITGLGEWDPETSHASFSTPLFSHFRRASSFNRSLCHQGGGASISEEGDAHRRPREELRLARTLADAQDAVLRGLASKIAALLMLSDDDEVTGSRSMSEYGMDSLVAVEMRNWIFREFDVMLPVLELLANIRVDVMAAKVVRESRVTDKAVLGGEE